MCLHCWTMCLLPFLQLVIYRFVTVCLYRCIHVYVVRYMLLYRDIMTFILFYVLLYCSIHVMQVCIYFYMFKTRFIHVVNHVFYMMIIVSIFFICSLNDFICLYVCMLLYAVICFCIGGYACLHLFVELFTSLHTELYLYCFVFRCRYTGS